MDKRHYHIIIGSKSFFDTEISKIDIENASWFLEQIRLWDASKQVIYVNEPPIEKKKVSLLIIKNDNYHGIVDSAHDRLGGLIEDLTVPTAEIYVHNPPQNLSNYLMEQKSRQLIDLSIQNEEYTIKREPKQFLSNIKSIAEQIIGQDEAINEISKSIWYLTTVERKNPYVIMLYGNSSLGKTELVREVAEKFFGGKFLEKHLSMFKNNNYSDYFFGDAPNRRSIGFDLLERESNLIFFDEIDKCPEHFYSAFYTLFDNTLFKDSTYDVDVSGAIIILTSNYQNEDEMKRNLGLPVFYRIDKFIHFNDFSTEVIYKVVMNELESRKYELDGKLTVDKVYEVVSKRLNATNENARTIKYKIQQVIEDLLFEEVESNAQVENQ